MVVSQFIFYAYRLSEEIIREKFIRVQPQQLAPVIAATNSLRANKEVNEETQIERGIIQRRVFKRDLFILYS